MKLQHSIYATMLAVVILFVAPGLVFGTLFEEDEEKGSVTGIVNVQATVSVIQDGQTVASGSTDGDTGEFQINDLSAGTYSVEVYPDAEGYKPSMINNVEVKAGETVDLGLIELEATEETEEE
jgi:uncharacterized protein (DUF2141 family)